MPRMKICSLLPSATEIVAALGLADHLVGISHECDYPPEITDIPIMVSSKCSTDQRSSKEIDQQVTETLASGDSLYTLNTERLVQAQPDLVITQGLCHVCALTAVQVEEAVRALPQAPHVLSLNPTRLDEVFTDIEQIGAATQRVSRASMFIAHLKDRMNRVTQIVPQSESRPRVACLEWFDPLYVAGHWVPEMVALAGGIDALGTAGEPSRRIGWNDLLQAAPDVLIFMPCGFTIERCRAELRRVEPQWDWSKLTAIQTGNAYLVNASAYFSRPGPRLIDGLEILASILHPSRFAPSSPSAAQAFRLPSDLHLHRMS